jgi:ComF family protein
MPSESCTICHAPTEGSQDLLCMNCLKTKPYYTSARAAFTYNFASKKIILGFKYGDKILHKKFMSEMIIAKHQALLEKADLICPIPLHKKRLRQRKYNQAALLSRTIAKNLNLPNIADLLIRTKNTPSQTNLPYKERIANIKNAFIINPKFINLIKKQNIVIIDDVLTTGATANECARILHKNGAAQTHIITFARTVAE